MWSYPVLRERCSCGASTESVAVDPATTNAFFEKWRSEHSCVPKKASAQPAAPAVT
jgi:hypothetical protein